MVHARRATDVGRGVLPVVFFGVSDEAFHAGRGETHAFGGEVHRQPGISQRGQQRVVLDFHADVGQDHQRGAMEGIYLGGREHIERTAGSADRSILPAPAQEAHLEER